MYAWAAVNAEVAKVLQRLHYLLDSSARTGLCRFSHCFVSVSTSRMLICGIDADQDLVGWIRHLARLVDDQALSATLHALIRGDIRVHLVERGAKLVPQRPDEARAIRGQADDFAVVRQLPLEFLRRDLVHAEVVKAIAALDVEIALTCAAWNR